MYTNQESEEYRQMRIRDGMIECIECGALFQNEEMKKKHTHSWMTEHIEIVRNELRDRKKDNMERWK